VARIVEYGRWVPTILRLGSARFFFYSNEAGEPPHIHVERAGATAKFWLDPVSLASSSRLSDHELRWLERQVEGHRERFLEAWREYFGA
jgi:hypothetical protein